MSIHPAGGDQWIVGPESDPAVASIACGRHAGVDQATPQAVPPPCRDEQDPQHGRLIVVGLPVASDAMASVSCGSPRRAGVGLARPRQ